jgi:hypothetical protein
MVYAGDNKMVGAQSGGTRFGHTTPGVGYYAFTPIHPCGVPDRDDQFDRKLQTVYAYGRLFPQTPVAAH